MTMILTEEVLAKLLEYKIINDLPQYLIQVKSEWEDSHILSAVPAGQDPIILPPDPLALDDSIPFIVIAGQDAIDIERIDRYPAAYVFVTDVTPQAAVLYQQESTDGQTLAAAIRIVQVGTDYDVLEKQIYRYTDAVYRMMRYDRYLNGLGWYVAMVAKHYSGIEPLEPLLKAGQVSFMVNTVVVA